MMIKIYEFKLLSKWVYLCDSVVLNSDSVVLNNLVLCLESPWSSALKSE